MFLWGLGAFICGAVSVGNKIDFKWASALHYNDPKYDYRIDLVTLAKLIRLTCFRQLSCLAEETQKGNTAVQKETIKSLEENNQCQK